MTWLSTAQTAHRLGVKPATVYAYVSRGVLHNHRDPATRRSRFDDVEVEQLAVRGRPRQASQSRALDLQIETSITQIGDHAIRLRGLDLLHLARTATFEQVAELIWLGELPDASPVWTAGHVDVPAVPGDRGRLFDRLRLVVALDAMTASREREPGAFIDTARRLIATLVDSLPLQGDGRTPRLVLPGGAPLRSTVAGRLWVRLSPRRPSPAVLAAMNAALVLLADHEMAASTLAARVAASTRAGVHDVVMAGLGPLGGPLHGGESERVRRMLARAASGSVRDAVEDALQRYGRVPGHGQILYPLGDPRATVLLSMLREAGPHPALDLVDEVTAEVARRRLPPPNVDLALAALGEVAAMPLDAGAAIFTSARIVGWTAHALEERTEQPVRFRPRAVYVGPPPRP